MGQSQFGDAPESQAQPVNLLGTAVELAQDAPVHSTKRDGVALMIPGATGELVVSTANPLPVSVVGGGGGGDASAANQTTQIAHEAAIETAVESIDTKTPALGQALMAASSPVVIASNQSAVPVSAASLPLPTGAATEASLASLAAEDFATQTTLAALDAKVVAVNTGAVVVSSSALPTGAATEATLAAASAKLPAALGQTTMAASLSVAIASNQSTLPISAASLPLPTGAATENSLTKIFVTPGTANDTNGIVPAAGNTNTSAPTYTNGQINALSLTTDGHLRVDGSAKTQPVSAASLPLPTGASTSAAQTTAQTSLDLIDDVPTAANGAFSKGAPAMGQFDDTASTDATENNCMPMRITSKRALHVNLRDTTGTERGTATNAIVAGGRGAIATTPGGITEGESVPLFCDSQGRLVVRQHGTPDKLTQNLITLTSTTETTLIAAGGSTLFRDLTMLMFSNTSATGVRIDIRDATGGTVRLSFWLPGGVSTGNLVESSIWKQTTANNNWTAQLSAAVTDVRVMAQAIERVTPTF